MGAAPVLALSMSMEIMRERRFVERGREETTREDTGGQRLALSCGVWEDIRRSRECGNAAERWRRHDGEANSAGRPVEGEAYSAAAARGRAANGGERRGEELRAKRYWGDGWEETVVTGR